MVEGYFDSEDNVYILEISYICQILHLFFSEISGALSPRSTACTDVRISVPSHYLTGSRDKTPKFEKNLDPWYALYPVFEKKFLRPRSRTKY